MDARVVLYSKDSGSFDWLTHSFFISKVCICTINRSQHNLEINSWIFVINVKLCMYLWVLVQVTNPSCVEGWRPPDDAMDLVPFVEEQLSQVWAILQWCNTVSPAARTWPTHTPTQTDKVRKLISSLFYHLSGIRWEALQEMTDNNLIKKQFCSNLQSFILFMNFLRF